MSEWHYGVKQADGWVNGWWPADVARTLLPVVELGARVLGAMSLERQKSLERQSPPRISAQSYAVGRNLSGLR